MAARSGIAFAVAGALAALTIFGDAPTVDNSIEALLSAGDEHGAAYDRFRERFGTDDIILVQLEGEPLDALLEHAAAMTAVLEADPATSHVVTPTDVYSDSIAVLTDDVFRDDEEAVAAATRDLAGPLGRRLQLLDVERRIATVYAFSRAVLPAAREPLAAALQTARERAATDGIAVRIAGPPLLNLTLDRAGRDVAAVALPLLVVVCLLVALLALRSVFATLAVFAPVGLTVLASDRAYALTGLSTNLVVDIAKPLLFVLLLAGGIHIVTAYRAAYDGDARRAAADAIRSKGRPAILALVTTAIGFCSLALSDIAPIRRFGMVTAAGLGFGVLTVVVLVPAFVVLLWPKPAPLTFDPIAEIAARFVRFGARYAKAVVGVALAIVAAGAVAFTQLPTEPHAIRYFAAEHPLRADYEALEGAGLGLSTLEMVVTATTPFTSAGGVLALDELAAKVEALPGVRAVVGLPLLLREVNHRAAGEDALPSEALLETILDDDPALLRELLSPDGTTARLSATIATLDADGLDELSDAIDTLPAPLNAELEITGSYRLLLAAQRGLLQTLTNSLALTFVLMQLILIVAVRSLRLGLLAILPNVLPVAFGFVAMIALGISLDVGTAMTAAIALGIAVDDTLHFVLAYRDKGLEGAARTTGQAIVTSSLVIGAGFGVLVVSDFGPTRAFGFLAALAMLGALIADLVVLPAALRLFAK